MARPRSFDAAQAVASAAACFRELGYAATSVDDLVAATGLHRGSLYGAFGSKRGLFLAALLSTAPAADRTPPTSPDALLTDAAGAVVTTQFGSTSMLQRRLGVGHARAEALMAQLEEQGVVGPQHAGRTREVLVAPDDVDAAVARVAAAAEPDARTLDLLLVAALELAPHDDEVRAVVARATASLPGAPAVLGRRLLERARVAGAAPGAPSQTGAGPAPVDHPPGRAAGEDDPIPRRS